MPVYTYIYSRNEVSLCTSCLFRLSLIYVTKIYWIGFQNDKHKYKVFNRKCDIITTVDLM